MPLSVLSQESALKTAKFHLMVPLGAVTIILFSFSFSVISLSYKTKDYCIQLAKAQVEQIGRKDPPPAFW